MILIFLNYVLYFFVNRTANAKFYSGRTVIILSTSPKSDISEQIVLKNCNFLRFSCNIEFEKKV